MNKRNPDAAWAILIERKAERKESRIAFIAALIAERCRTLVEAPLPPHMCEAFAVELVRLASGIKREAEAACNYDRNDAQIAAGQRLEDRFAALAEALGFEVRTGGDPRGACAYLIDPHNRKGDGWGEGYAVYA